MPFWIMNYYQADSSHAVHHVNKIKQMFSGVDHNNNSALDCLNSDIVQYLWGEKCLVLYKIESFISYKNVLAGSENLWGLKNLIQSIIV